MKHYEVLLQHYEELWFNSDNENEKDGIDKLINSTVNDLILEELIN